MSDGCEIEEGLARGSKRKILWLVLVINLIMFFVEGIAGWLAQSNALMADALDMLGDAAIYGFSLFVIQHDPVWRTRAAILKGIIMSIFALGILGSAIYRITHQVLPDASTMALSADWHLQSICSAPICSCASKMMISICGRPGYVHATMYWQTLEF